MLARKTTDDGKDGGKGCRKEKGDGKDDDNDDSEEDDTDSESQSSGKPKGKHTTKKKPASAYVTPIKATKKKATPATLAAWPRKPNIGWEVSRKQCMCRSGKGGT